MKNDIFLEKNNKLGLMQSLFIAAAFTSSFDIFLIVNLGLNFRISQILLLLPICVVMANMLEKKFIAPLGIKWLILWSLFILIFIPNGSFPERSAGYFAWLVINIATIFACVQIFSSPGKIKLLMKWYIYSFVALALYGLLQFVSPVAGLGDFLLVQQWWIPGVLVRINGFSYEPSFYSTYLLLGWIICAYFMEVRNSLFSRRKLKFCFYTITLAMILSSSRMGILMMILWYVQHPVRFFMKLLRGEIDRKLAKIVVAMVVLLAGIVMASIYVIGIDNIAFLFQGVGLFGGASHSVNDRENGLRDTLALFFNSPFIGTSLGGVAPGIANLHGVVNPDFETVKFYEGNAIFAEVLAASGIFGFIPFMIYIFMIVVQPMRLAKKLAPEQAQILMALCFALVFEFLILQFNQNILRQYLWMHISVMAAVYAVFKRQSVTSPAPDDQIILKV
ncbi:O-antigen ligase family protein [Janthinobacterium lividum]|uniref:O-antigen ligase family protein n=1 Tax=Janthinobacterium lividum TaxID=29581 RepID=UPI001B82179F|nr:O-antigen ligase family protein [Janthinobacterium lividum]MBR7633450.1 O-antigen ligase family protein [Janthinobacterium lividum]